MHYIKRELVLLSTFDGRCMLVMLMRIQNWPTTGWIVKSHDCYMILHIFSRVLRDSTLRYVGPSVTFLLFLFVLLF